MFTVDTRGVFTAHAHGCQHLRSAHGSFDIDAKPTRAAVVDALAEFASGDDPSEFVDFAPCLKALP